MTRILAGRSKGRRLQAPKGERTRPTGARVKQTLFDILAPLVPGSRFLDVCAGSGGIGLEALSRGAARVVFVEQDGAAVAAIRANANALGGVDVDVYRQDVRVALPALGAAGQRFDLAFLDPPYAGDLYEPVLAALSALLAPGGLAVAEHFHKRALPETIGRLGRTRTVRVGEHCLTFYRRDEECG